MRAREFIINIPINIKINGNGEPEIDMTGGEETVDQNPVMISPQQQELELKKAEQGKMSPAINKMLQNDTVGGEVKTPIEVGARPVRRQTMR